MNRQKIFHQSDINQYLICPAIYKYKNVLKIPEPGRHPSAVTGSTLHWAIDTWHKSGQDLLPREKTDKIIDELWNKTLSGQDPLTLSHNENPVPPVMWEWSKKTAEELLCDAKEVFYNYTGQEYNLSARVLCSECDFSFVHHGNHFEGTIDQIRIAPGDTLELWDFKFSSYTPSQAYLERSIQFSLYAFAMWKAAFFIPVSDLSPVFDHAQIGELPSRYVWYHLSDLIPYKRNYGGYKKGDIKGDPRRFVMCDLNLVKNSMKNIRSIISLIKKDRFYFAPQNAGACLGFCHYQNACLNELAGHAPEELHSVTVDMFAALL